MFLKMRINYSGHIFGIQRFMVDTMNFVEEPDNKEKIHGNQES